MESVRKNQETGVHLVIAVSECSRTRLPATPTPYLLYSTTSHSKDYSAYRPLARLFGFGLVSPPLGPTNRNELLGSGVCHLSNPFS